MAKIVIILIFTLGLFFRLYNINQSLWLDEAISVMAVKNHSYSEILTKFIVTDVHPPLYYLFLKFWTSFFGYSEIVVRFPSVVFSLATIGCTYAIGKKLFNTKIAQIASLFLAINPLFIYYSQEARMYAMATFFVTAGVYFLISNKRFYAWLMIVLSLFTEYIPYLMIPIYFAIVPTRQTFFLLWHVFNALLLWSPLLLAQIKLAMNLADESPIWKDIVGKLSLKSVILVWIKSIFGRITFDNKYLYALLSFLASINFGAVLLRAQNKRLWIWFVGPIFLGIIVSAFLPIMSYHRFIFVLPAFCLLLASGCRNSKTFTALTTIIFMVSIQYFNFNNDFHRENWRGATTYMERLGGLIVMPSLAQSSPLDYYSKSLAYTDSVNLNGEILSMVHPLSNVFLLRYVQEIFDPKDVARKMLEDYGFHKVEEKYFNGVLIWKYKRIT